MIRRDTLRSLDVDLLCTGHVHERGDFVLDGTRVIVPGATERRSFAEADNEPGYYDVTWDDAMTCEFCRIDAQPMTARSVSAADLPDGRETEALIESVERWTSDDGILRVELADPDGRVDREAVRRANQSSFYFELA